MKKQISSKNAIEAAVTTILSELGEDIDRQGLQKTPERVAASLKYLVSGNHNSIDEIVNGALFDCKTKGMVVQKDIEFYSLCEHHLLPFFGQVHIAYLPNEKIIGLSKLARIVDVFARRLQVQEQLTEQIAEAIESILKPRGVAVMVAGSHFCMMMRGVSKQTSSTISRVYRGEFEHNAQLQNEFTQIVS